MTQTRPFFKKKGNGSYNVVRCYFLQILFLRPPSEFSMPAGTKNRSEFQVNGTMQTVFSFTQVVIFNFIFFQGSLSEKCSVFPDSEIYQNIYKDNTLLLLLKKLLLLLTIREFYSLQKKDA